MTTKGTRARATKPPSRRHEPDPADGEAEAADYYNQTRDLSGFDGGEVVELESTPAGTRNVTLSIRLSPEELQTLGRRAEAAGMRLTAYIRAAALQSEAPPVDDDLLDTAAEVVDLVAALRSSVEAAKARREQVTGRSSTVVTG
jgi:hypothetical protein